MIGYGYGTGISPNVASLSPYDADAALYFTNAGITDATEKSSINSFILELKAQSLYTTIHAMWLLVCGSATSRVRNVINPLDSDAAHRGVFTGGWTHTSSGSQPNGTTGYMDCNFIPNDIVALNSAGVTIASTTESAATATFMYDFGSLSTADRFEGVIGYTNRIYGLLNTPGTDFLANTNSTGLFTICRTGVTDNKMYRNASSLGTTTTGSSAKSTRSVYLGARNADGTAQFFANRNYRIFLIHTGWNDTQTTNFYNAYTTFITNLGI